MDNGKSPEFVDTDFPRAKGEKPRSKLLFTVKPGGIAGYLGTWASYNPFGESTYFIPSITMQYGFLCGYQSQNRYVRWLPSEPRSGKITREASDCPLDAR